MRAPAFALRRASALGVLTGCAGMPGTSPEPVVATGITISATVGSTRFVTREHMLAAGEMQISGEPLAEAMGRDLSMYNRFIIPSDLYLDVPNDRRWIDLAGFSTGIESYEYSKQPMNNLGFESGAGTSMAYAPLVNPGGASGTAATAGLAATVQKFATRSNALGRFVFPAGTFPTNNRSGDVNPAGAGLAANNPLGWPGIWPTAHVFESFDPTIDPTGVLDLACAITSDDNGTGVKCTDYECDATTLHLVNRASQIDPTITTGADGFSGWKYGLWVLNYLQSMHDSTEAAVTIVDDADLPNVGTPGNQIMGADGTAPGTYLGSSDIEGFQAQMFINSVDNRAEDWLRHLTTTDGVTLSGFASLADALAYNEQSPLRWFPGKLAVTETDDGSGFPRPAYHVASADSDLMDSVGLALSYATFYALTDTSNPDVGGSQSAIVYFDGDPFAADNQLADGEPTLHDRALAMLRVAIVNLDRLHADPASGILVDHVAMSGATPSRGSTVATTSLAYTVIALRTTLRALGSQLELYSNNTPDTEVATTPLDGLPIAASDPALEFGGLVHEMLRTHADLLLDHLTDASGRAFSGWNLATNAVSDDLDLLDSHTAAIRGLFAGYLATGDVRYRDRAIAVYQRVEAVFYDSDARIYSVTPAPATTVEYTPLRFALIQSALRDMYELVATRPGGEQIEPVLENRLGRLDKLVLNGWDDRDQDRILTWPDECVNVQSGIPRGGMQMGERTLTGEIGSATMLGHTNPTFDREHDCVPEIDDAHLPAALADSITFEVTRP
jgi:hypothetical protein